MTSQTHWAQYTRDPTRPVGGADPLDDVLHLGCLAYGGDDGPYRWAAARALLAEHPELPARSVHLAAALADAGSVGRLLAADAGAASREGGPHAWPPLLYLTYARLDPAVGEADTLATARLLLAAGADPNAGFLHRGLVPPFTAITGVFGEGESGPTRQPRHPHSRALARLLLDAGADANDDQALYNRMFTPGDDHLVLLFEYGLGTGSGGPWRARLGDEIATPAEMVAGQLARAVEYGLADRVRLLLAHGAPPGELAGVAARNGWPDLVDLLVGAGARRPELTGADALLAAALAGDRATAERLAAQDRVLAAARAARPAAILHATETGRPDAIRLLVGLGFDVNACDRSTALHQAASADRLDLIDLLLSLGADPNARDTSFDSTPLGWAEYGHQRAAVARLAPMTGRG